ncbi:MULTISPECIES: glycosyl hydrolase family 18 protein [unclassified Arthrobacter]|uniref:glycosyl hydrolase family 18 protein n=1 Tax=unclassified Arthrobacter TaxID=235627 RepID=UPI00339613A7
MAAVYWTRWNSAIRLTQVPQSFNVLYLFAAGRSGDLGGIGWGMNDIAADIKTVRARGQRVVLSTGGAGQGINFSSRTVSQRFVDSVVRINAELGGTLASPMIDGVDFNTFEAEATPETAEYLWMFAELKRQFGQEFGITSPPAPWKDQDKAMIREALSTGLMTYAGPQMYDGPGLADPAYIIKTTRDWVQNVAGGDASKIVVGFGMEDMANFSSIEQILTAWRAIEKEFPGIRGAFLWQHKTDFDRGWAFAMQVAPLILDKPIPEQPMPWTQPYTPTQPPGPMVRIGSASCPLAGIDIARERNALVAYTDEAATTTTNPYGCEVTVTGGKVIQINDRQVGESVTGTPILRGGFVLSGHGEARTWLLANAKIGAAVEVVTVSPRPGLPTRS